MIIHKIDQGFIATLRFFLFFAITLLSIGCEKPATSQGTTFALYDTDVFKKYWYSGMAEINTYTLSQSRYGETREGKAVLIFVTEDFSISKQVKLDQPEKSPADKITVLKVNFTKNFVTGIYPYSLMLSAFTPVEASRAVQTLKVTMSAQEWCGQVFAQLNLKNKRYALQSNSYFEQEGDATETYVTRLLEDELWNRIRLNPEALPVGELEILPGLFYTRLLHVPLSAQKAFAAKKDEGENIVYEVSFPEQKRTLQIYYESKFPHRITRWEEKFMERGREVTTSATLDKTIRTDYWTKNKNEFIPLRDSLGLSRKNY